MVNKPQSTNTMDKKLTYTLFLQRENDFSHHSYDDEMKPYIMLSSGDLQGVKQLYNLFTSKSTGYLSDDPTKNYRYMFVASITLVTRFCIKSGMEEEVAYSLSDLYIQQMDSVASLDEIFELYKKMTLDFANRMTSIHSKPMYSKPIREATDYIYDHLHSIINVTDVADAVILSPTYLSVLFKKETGVSISDYIRNKRLEAAANMLKYSDFSYLEISNYLAFSSQSHFVAVFKRYMGMTPRRYRMKYYNVSID